MQRIPLAQAARQYRGPDDGDQEDGAARVSDPVITPFDRRRRRPTATSRFGTSRREGHDASAFYARFSPPVLSDDVDVQASQVLDVLRLGDARHMDDVASNSVALVVTSPPYFAGKEYEADLGREGVPASYLEYLQLLREVFAECARVLEPGGRIAVNVANLGRRPYRSLSSDVVSILQDDLGLLLRGEIIWVKGRASTGSCAWGSFQHPSNPVLRDLTERIVIAGKGRFSRAIDPSHRRTQGMPSVATITRDEFLEATTDVWELAPERASRVGHPAPFPVELPLRTIELYTYEGDVVLDPFMGSGTTAVAAIRSDRHYIGYDTDPSYVATAQARLDEEHKRVATGTPKSKRATSTGARRKASPPPARSSNVPASKVGVVDLAVAQGLKATQLARALIEDCGLMVEGAGVRIPETGVEVDFVAGDRGSEQWAFRVCGSLVNRRNGLSRADVLWRTIGEAAVLHRVRPDIRLVVLTTDLPGAGSTGEAALRQVTGARRPIRDVILLSDSDARVQLRLRARRQNPQRARQKGR